MTDLLTPAMLTERARSIANGLIRDAKREADEGITWGRGYNLAFEATPDAGIFNGRIGEALFLASLYSITRDDEYATHALAAIKPLRVGLARDEYAHALAKEIGLGLTGVGAIVYALVRIASLLDQPDLLISARRAAAAITHDSLRRDYRFEVFWGAAGALLGLLALVDHDGDHVLERAEWCAAHLMRSRSIDSGTGYRAWDTNEGRPVTGFAHGSSGIAHALLQLHKRSGRPDLYAAAMEAFAFERGVYDPTIGDWPDHVDQPRDKMISGWCHGAAGVGLSRLGALEVIKPADESDIVSDLQLALRRVAARPAHGNDSLCCGTFGRVDFLLEASARLDNSSLLTVALSQASVAVARAEASGFRLAPNTDGPHAAGGLWQGQTGIGYALLRLANRGTLPCIMMWQ
jgi:lantibiotic modifying enzyme